MGQEFIIDARSQAERSLREWMRDTPCSWISLTHHHEFLSQISKRPDLLLQRLSKREILIPLGGGIYCIPDTHPLLQVHARMQQLGDYMISYRTGALSHQLLESSQYGKQIQVAVAGSSISRPSIKMFETHLILTRMITSQRWFGSEVVHEGQEWYVRSNIERLLTDVADRPKQVGSVLDVRDIWVNSLDKNVNYQRLLEYSLNFGASVVRRVGWWLEQLGLEESENFRQYKGKSGAVLLDASKQYKDIEQWNIDKKWGLRVNIPQKVIETIKS